MGTKQGPGSEDNDPAEVGVGERQAERERRAVKRCAFAGSDLILQVFGFRGPARKRGQIEEGGQGEQWVTSGALPFSAWNGESRAGMTSVWPRGLVKLPDVDLHVWVQGSRSVCSPGCGFKGR